ncbi:hypothetical protein [Vibrio diabolicus]|uniref:hypothetical protein n=1 Tax=Vibrio diabolicus TaxID=50719 RepID=UPI00193B6CF1|nr:hypothetical protein [Vibrio diabolicus]EGQ9696263.1 hypothetical protein [Vibrio parahaemolyticus]EJX1342463.1 hypothetical protein [Vibrio parahaemolyticus]
MMAILLIAYIIGTTALGGIYYQEIQFNYWWSGSLFGFGAGAAFYNVVLVPLFALRSDLVSLSEAKRLLRNTNNTTRS